MGYDDFIILLLVWFHFIMDNMVEPVIKIIKGDHVLCNLFVHGAIYSLPFMLIGVNYAIVNAVLHIAVDSGNHYVNSHILDIYEGTRYRKYLAQILRGWDNMLHITILIMSYFLMHNFDVLGYSLL